MRKYLLAFGLFSATTLYGYTDNDKMNQYETQNFLQTLQGEINKQQALVNQITQQAARTDVIYPAAITKEYENAYIMLNVKKTLYANFVDTPSIQSPLIQAKLLQIFKKSLVTPADLAELDVLVKQERPKYAPQQVQQVSQPVRPNTTQPVVPSQPATVQPIPVQATPAVPAPISSKPNEIISSQPTPVPVLPVGQ